MDPAAWGPPIWDAFHRHAARYPVRPGPADRHRARRWFTERTLALPCGACASKYQNLLRSEDHGLAARHLRSRRALFEWTVSLHNVVNMLLRKPLYSFEDAAQKYGVT